MLCHVPAFFVLLALKCALASFEKGARDQPSIPLGIQPDRRCAASRAPEKW
jgi:hypothetical protein